MQKLGFFSTSLSVFWFRLGRKVIPVDRILLEMFVPKLIGCPLREESTDDTEIEVVLEAD